jgi:flagellar biosynthesis/type III secretory pathway protein FliH
VRIAIHPSQRAALIELLPQLKMQWPTMQHAELVDDATLAIGGCRVFTHGGAIDADLNQQLDRIEAELMPSGDVESNA